jgi:hypothetical protein
MKSKNRTIIHTPDALTAALNCCRGNYQRALVYGTVPWSNAGLRGLARKHWRSYSNSRFHLLQRIKRDCVVIVREPRGSMPRTVEIVCTKREIPAILADTF